MNARPSADPPQLLAVASSIADGKPVDWDHVAAGPDEETTAVLHELRALEAVSRVSQAAPKTWGSFTILGQIGHGAYGTVYRALDINLNLEIALKVICPRGLIPALNVDRALSEPRMLAQVTHPNVVRVFGAERVGSEIGVSMELVSGPTLEQLVRRQGPFSARETMLLGVDVCCALAAVHAARLVHGDVKAQNVMRAPGGRTVLMDFGAGYDVKADRLGGRGFAGTPLYLAPEVFDGHPRTSASDIYSVGVLLFHLATGTYPIDGHTDTEVRQWHRTHAPRRLLRDVRPDLPDAFIRVVDRALAERPDERYQTAGEFEADLNRALRHDAPTPVPLSRVTVGRTPALVAAGLMALVAVGLGYRLWSAEMASNETGGRPVPEVVAAAAAVPDSTATPGDAYRIEAAFYRHQDGGIVRLGQGGRVAPGDRLSLHVVSSVPTYLYVVNEDDHGKSFLLFPLPVLAAANPLPAGTRHEIPGLVNGARVSWEVSTAGGREHFLIFASPQPLSPAFQRVFDALPRASADRPVLAQRLTRDMVGALRGVGGLATAPAPLAGPGLRAEFGSPLPSGEETARGVWVRQLTLDNPRR